jgi:putative redox protein
MTAQPKPPVTAELIWNGDLRFGVTSGSNALVTDGDNSAGPSPVQLLAIGLAGCMAIDVVDIIRKGRHRLGSFRSTVSAERAPEPPRRITAATLTFHVQGDVPAHVVERAIALSRDKYCSVWHSLRQDIDLSTSFEILPSLEGGSMDGGS